MLAPAHHPHVDAEALAREVGVGAAQATGGAGPGGAEAAVALQRVDGSPHCLELEPRRFRELAQAKFALAGAAEEPGDGPPCGALSWRPRQRLQRGVSQERQRERGALRGDPLQVARLLEQAQRRLDLQLARPEREGQPLRRRRLCRAQAVPDVAQQRRVRVRQADEALLGEDVGVVEEEERPGRLAVAAGAAYLLVVGLDGPRSLRVDDETHVRPVDAHAKRARRDHDHRLPMKELVDGAPLRVGEPGVVAMRSDALGA